MRAYKVIINVIDHDDLGSDGIIDVIENTRYPNHCMSPTVSYIESVDIGEWADDHPLNQKASSEEEWKRLFADAAKEKS